MRRNGTKVEKPDGRAKPRKYDSDRHPQIAAALASTGKIEVEIADLMGIAVQTVQLWKKTHPEFATAMREGKEPANQAVEASLYKRACGYEYEETETIAMPGPDGKAVIKTVKKVKKQLAPDTTACIFWLKNRDPQRWCDVQKQEHSGDVFLSIIPPPKVKDVAEKAPSTD
jgi:hypothetical protein